MNYTFEPISQGRPIIITTLNGIGDLCWCAVKLTNMKKVLGIPKLTIKMHMAGDHRDTRSHEFIKRFAFVDFIVHSKFKIHNDPPNLGNRINYIDNGYDSYRKEYTFIVNPYIEWEGRIENIFPEVPPCYDFFNRSYISEKTDINFANNLLSLGYVKSQNRLSCICFHLGCTQNNTVSGMNRFEDWKIQDWADLARKLRQISDLPIYLIGAKYDAEYADRLMGLIQSENLNVINLCNKTTTTQTIEILRNSSLVVSFASGIGIASTYLGTPTVMFWMPEDKSVSPHHTLHFSNDFATNWAPPYSLGETYYPAYYFKDTVDKVFEACENMLDKSILKF